MRYILIPLLFCYTASFCQDSEISRLRNKLMINNINNTSDQNKPLSTAANIALANKVSVDAMSNYLTVVAAGNTYQPIGNYLTGAALNNYSTTAQANLLYQPIGNYLTAASLANYSTTGQANLLYQPIGNYVPTTRTINGAALNQNIVLTKSDILLGNVDNVSDLNKPLSTAAINTNTLKANLNGAAFTGAISSTVSIGYATGAGGSVVQATNKSTTVVLNKISGSITMNGAALAAAAEVAFQLTNSFIASTDVVIVNIQSVGTAGAYFVTVGAVANGSCSITVGNASAGSLSQAIVLNFCVIKSVAN